MNINNDLINRLMVIFRSGNQKVSLGLILRREENQRTRSPHLLSSEETKNRVSPPVFKICPYWNQNECSRHHFPRPCSPVIPSTHVLNISKVKTTKGELKCNHSTYEPVRRIRFIYTE